MEKILQEIKTKIKENMSNKFKKFYLGKIENIPLNYSPVLMIYPKDVSIDRGHTTCADKVLYQIEIKIVVDCHGKSNLKENLEEELEAQVKLWELIEKREADNSYSDDCIIGILRKNIRGKNYLMNDGIVVDFTQENIKKDNTTFFECNVVFRVFSNFVKR
jgi:hypothetical protein